MSDYLQRVMPARRLLAQSKRLASAERRARALLEAAIHGIADPPETALSDASIDSAWRAELGLTDSSGAISTSGTDANV